MEIFQSTLFPSALYTFCVTFFTFVCMPSVGNWVDSSGRLLVARVSTVGETAAIVAAAALMYLLAEIADSRGNDDPVHVLSGKELSCVCAMIVCGLAAELFSNASSLAVEKDWVVQIAGYDSRKLTETNTVLKRIDLIAKMFAPVAVGSFIELCRGLGYEPARSGAMGVVVLAILTTPLEYVLLRKVYDAFPVLHVKTPAPPNTASRLRQLAAGWKAYFEHDLCLASVGFCFLHMTVLDSGSIMTAYLKWAGISDGYLGAARGASAFCGVLGTYAYGPFERCLGSIPLAGLLSMWIFWLFTTPSVAAFYLDSVSDHLTGIVMIMAVMFSRPFLWIFDISENQLMQERVETAQRGSINSVQVAGSQLATCLINLACIVFSNPENFYILITASTGSVFVASLLFTLWFTLHRNDVLLPS
jgi:iron-regulated transporter 1